MGGVAGQEHPPDPPPVGEADVVAVAREADDRDVRRCDSLVAQDLPDGFLVEERLLVLLVAHRKLPAMVPQWSRAVDGRSRGVAVEAKPVVAGPFLKNFGVDHDPALARRCGR